MANRTAARASAPAATPESNGDSRRVVALHDGFYGVGAGASRIRAGQRFTLTDPKHFTKKWMARVPMSEPDDLEQARQSAPTRATRSRPDPVQPRVTPAASSVSDDKPTGDHDVLGGE